MCGLLCVLGCCGIVECLCFDCGVVQQYYEDGCQLVGGFGWYDGFDQFGYLFDYFVVIVDCDI